jgi:translation elongation factor EF-Tu-like GTPase
MEGKIWLMAEPFRMLVANIYSLPDGPAVTGVIEAGRVRVGDSLTLIGSSGEIPVKVVFIQAFQKVFEVAEAKDGIVGLTLSGVDHDQIRNRDLLVRK